MEALHSRYDPQREAERYISALNLPPQIRCFILIEPGLGYMIPILAERFPGARIIALHAAAVEGPQAENSNAAHWDPEHPLSPGDFLEQKLASTGALKAETIKIIEWQPSRDFYGQAYVKLLAAAAAAIRRFDAEKRTIKTFGRRWFRNFFRNLSLLRSFPVYGEIAVPLLITGAGPSLEESLPLIGALKKQQNCFIIAASSSVMALSCRGISPDMVLATDGGGWALLHLYELFRGPHPAGDAPFVLAAGFSAKLPSQCACLPILGISDGSRWQSLILRGLGIPHLVLPQRGTVTAAALDLAFALGRGKVCIAGMDLDTVDMRTHARPYSFDRLWQEKASRIQGEYGQRFFRREETKGGGSHKVYAEWFASQLASYPERLFTLGKNNLLFAGLPPLDAHSLPCGPAVASPRLREIPGASAGGNRVMRALEILKAGLEDPKDSPAISGELAPLLLPDSVTADTGELWETIASLVQPHAEAGTDGG